MANLGDAMRRGRQPMKSTSKKISAAFR